MNIFFLLIYRKDDAANRPKLEFVPKTLADLNIEGVSDGVNGITHSTPSVPPYPVPPASNQFIHPLPVKCVKPQPRIVQRPDPFAPIDPWSIQGIYFLFILLSTIQRYVNIFTLLLYIFHIFLLLYNFTYSEFSVKTQLI